MSKALDLITIGGCSVDLYGSQAVLVCNRGALGAVAFEGDIPSSFDDGRCGEGVEVKAFNILRAGDGFMSGLLKSGLAGLVWPVALKFANACGALLCRAMAVRQLIQV